VSPAQPGQIQQPIDQYNNVPTAQYPQNATVIGNQSVQPAQSPNIQNYQTNKPNAGYSSYPQSYGGYNTPTQQYSQTNTDKDKGTFLPREARKEMIIKNYAKILGHDPSESDLNFFLNTGIREDDLIKKMVDSQEHAELVKARQEIITTRITLESEQTELNQLRKINVEQKTIIDDLNQSIEQKNKSLTQLTQKIRELEQKNNSFQIEGKDKPTNKSSQKKYKGNLSDRVFKAFSDILE
jgi:hypothetical protein